MNEFAIIERYFNKAPTSASRVEDDRFCRPGQLPDKPASRAHDGAANGIVLGIGDDAAIVQPPAGQQLVISTDTLVAGRHFGHETAAHAIGWKAAAVNLSDMAAMGATPCGLLLALSLPQIQQDWLADFSAGFFACCRQVPLIGGDTTQSPTLSITVTALGWVPSNRAIRRTGAQVGDLIVVSNTLGDAAYALRHPHSAVQQALDYPQPQLQLGAALQGYASSMLDISDGLAQDLNHILTASQVAARIHLQDLPLSATLAQLPRAQAWQLALCGGDDYQLCFTIAPQRFDEFCLDYAGRFTLQVIGTIEAGSGLQVLDAGQVVRMNLQGYQHFDQAAT